MATTIKGICKSFKFISQIFVVKEREMEIGYPTDVKHVAHIGWESQCGSGPSWINEYRTAPNFSRSLGDLGGRRDANPMSITSWPTPDFDESTRSEPISNNILHSEHPNASKKNKRRKTKSTSPSRSSSSSSTRQSRAAKPKVTFNETVPTLQA